MAYLSTLFILGGLFFYFVGVVGLLRFPDVYTRLHATTKCDTLGAGMILFGLALQSTLPIALRLLLLILFIWITNPTGAHIMAKVAYLRNTPLAEGSFFKDYTGEGQEK